jgi:hypothetical protein
MADPDFKILELARSAHHVPLVGEEHRKVKRDGRITGVQAHSLKATDRLLLHKQIRNLQAFDLIRKEFNISGL